MEDIYIMDNHKFIEVHEVYTLDIFVQELINEEDVQRVIDLINNKYAYIDNEQIIIKELLSYELVSFLRDNANLTLKKILKE